MIVSFQIDRGGRRSVAQRGDLRVELVAEIADSATAEFRVELARLRDRAKTSGRPRCRE